MTTLLSPHLQEQRFRYQLELGQVYDVDVDGKGQRCSLLGHGSKQILDMNGRHIDLPVGWVFCEFPIVRWLDHDRVIIVSSNKVCLDAANAWIIDQRVPNPIALDLGSDILDILVVGHRFVVAHHPDLEGNDSKTQQIHSPGLVIYDHDGQLCAKLGPKELGPSFQRVRCLARWSQTEFVFVPDRASTGATELTCPIIHYDLKSGATKVVESEFHDPIAICKSGDLTLLYSPEEYEDQIFALDRSGACVAHIGAHPDIYRGLSDGRFLAQLDEVTYSEVSALTSQISQQKRGGSLRLAQ